MCVRGGCQRALLLNTCENLFCKIYCKRILKASRSIGDARVRQPSVPLPVPPRVGIKTSKRKKCKKTQFELYLNEYKSLVKTFFFTKVTEKSNSLYSAFPLRLDKISKNLMLCFSLPSQRLLGKITCDWESTNAFPHRLSS